MVDQLMSVINSISLKVVIITSVIALIVGGAVGFILEQGKLQQRLTTYEIQLSQQRNRAMQVASIQAQNFSNINQPLTSSQIQMHFPIVLAYTIEDTQQNNHPERLSNQPTGSVNIRQNPTVSIEIATPYNRVLFSTPEIQTLLQERVTTATITNHPDHTGFATATKNGITVSYNPVQIFWSVPFLAAIALIFSLIAALAAKKNQVEDYLEWRLKPALESLETNALEFMNDSSRKERPPFRLDSKIEEVNEIGQSLNAIVQWVWGRIDHTEEQARITEERNLNSLNELAKMSHEIRTPLYAIISYADQIKSGKYQKADSMDRANKIWMNGELLIEIINSVLDIAKIESGEMTIEQQPMDLDYVIKKSEMALRFRAEEKGIELRFVTDSLQDRQIVGDQTRLTQILNNLLSNAIKFTSQGKVTFRTKIELQSNNDAKIYFEVLDQGEGMTQAQQDKVFEKYTQADTSTTRKHGGTGLGLPITKELIEKMGGTIGLESTPGVGSKFFFTLRFKTVKFDSEGAKPMLKEKVWTGTPHFRGEVLVVDDSQINREILQEFLDDVGVTAHLASSGKEAIKKINQNFDLYDLVFMDVWMDEMDGVQATEIIRGNDYTKPIVVFTADSINNFKTQFEEKGFTDHLTKPAKKEEIWTILEKYLQQIEKPKVSQKKEEDKPETVLERSEKKKEELTNDQKMIARFIDGTQEYSEILSDPTSTETKIKLAAHSIKGLGPYIGSDRLTTLGAMVQDDPTTENAYELYRELSEIVRLLKEKQNPETALDVNFFKDLLQKIEDEDHTFGPQLKLLEKNKSMSKVYNQLRLFDLEGATETIKTMIEVMSHGEE